VVCRSGQAAISAAQPSGTGLAVNPVTLRRARRSGPTCPVRASQVRLAGNKEIALVSRNHAGGIRRDVELARRGEIDALRTGNFHAARRFQLRDLAARNRGSVVRRNGGGPIAINERDVAADQRGRLLVAASVR